MAKTAQAAEHSLEVRRTIAASRERVFKAWTREEEVKKWSAPGALTVPVAKIDLKVGGKFRIEMQAPDGTRHIGVGEYREVTPPKRLVYTWTWEGESQGVRDSVITVQFEDRGASTEVILRHEKLPNAKEVTGHTEGWTGCLEKLAALF
jgi:uncharacterized protein YndB with AHSA1/START domain